MRYAIYATPSPADPLAQAGARWLGRDLYTGEATALDPVAGVDAPVRSRLVAAPARYGFHGTLMAPFALAAGFTEDDLVTALAALAPGLDPVAIPRLELARIGDCLALVPAHRVAPLDRLAARVVVYFQPFRASLDEAEIAARRAAGLSPGEEGNLRRWGYAYVFDAFRFHMTLTGGLGEAASEPVRAALLERFGAFLGEPFVIDRLVMVVEPEPGAPFRFVTAVPLMTQTERAFARA